eukprot:scaffold4402_cov130-Skeletonema_marinoi.AAC.5
MIVQKHLIHGSSIVWSYRRRYNVEGDLMRHLRWPQALLSSTISYLTLSILFTAQARVACLAVATANYGTIPELAASSTL